MTLYKHLVYVDFISFIRQSGSPPYSMEMLVFKNIKKYILFYQIKKFHIPKDWFLSISKYLVLNMLFQKKSKRVCVCGRWRRWGGRGRGRGRDWGHTFLNKNPEMFGFFTLPLEIVEKAKLHLWIFHKVVWHPLKIPRQKIKTDGIPCTQPPAPCLDFFYNSPMQTKVLR